MLYIERVCFNLLGKMTVLEYNFEEVRFLNS
jgi:hypothetical protein